MTARLLLIVATLVVLLGGCATFPDAGSRDWRPQAEGEGELGGPPQVAPEERTPPPSGAPSPQQQGAAPAPQPCVDPDPQVVAACLGPVGAVAVLPQGDRALVAERRTGRVLEVRRDATPQPVATVPVDPVSPVDPAGGLTGLVLSPGYAEDRLLYALSEGRVWRIAPGEAPKPVLEGLPPGGALAVDADGSSLLVATPAGAGPLAGAVLRIDTLGRPAPGNPDRASPVLARGLTAPGGVCVDPAARTTWVTDRTPGRDVLHRVTPGTLGAPAWTWPDRPGVAGCTVLPGAVVVAQSTGRALFVLNPGAEGTFTGDPKPVLEGTYGRIGPVTLAPDGLLWLGTVNRDGGAPGATDDRVVRIQPPTGGGASAI